MKKLLLLISVFGSIQVIAQFGPEQFVDSNYYNNDILLTDMNNDGYNDLVTARAGAVGSVSIYYSDSIGGLGLENVISTNSYKNKAADFGDINADGWMDIISASQTGIITTYTNNTNSSFSQMDVATGGLFPIDLISADFNSDGYADFVTMVNMSIDVYINDQSSNFTVSNVADSTEYYSMCVGDIDGNGSPDIISGSGKVFTFINDGNGSFTKDPINESITNYPVNLCELADMDNDGDLDLVVYYTNVVDKVDWYSNDGNGAFSYESTITSLANNLYNISIGDIDNDSYNDVCLGYDQSGDFIWIRNLGNGSFSNEVVINANHSFIMRTNLGDVDGDGDLDAFFTSTYGVYYHLNQTILVGFEEKSISNLRVYPNPAHHQFVIEGTDIENAIIFIYDALGQEIKLNYKYGLDKVTINTKDQAKGIYFVSIRYKDRVETKTVFLK